MTALINFDDGTTIYQVAGTSTGRVGKLDSGNDDFGDKIVFDFIDRWRSYTEMYSKAKSVSGVMVSSLNGAGTRFQYQNQKFGVNEWLDLGTLDENYDSLFPNASTEDFNISRLRLTGASSGTPIIFCGIEILTIQDKGFEQN